MPSERGLEGATRLFEKQRGRLMGLAYRMLGSRAEAEDLVQDAWLRWCGVDASAVDNPESYLVRIVTRLSLDRLKAARAQREVYVGEWLPEPVLDAEAMSPLTAAELADDLSFALLLALERLSPAERAAFLMHDVFDRSYPEIAKALEKSEPACRKLVSRARRAVRQERSATSAAAEEHERLLRAFVEATASGDVARFDHFLAADVIAYSDGGGKVAAALNPIYGRDKVVRFVLGIARKSMEAGATLRLESVELNGLPGLLVFLDDELAQALSLQVTVGLVSRLFFVRNPDKLEAVSSGFETSAPQPPGASRAH